MEYNPLALYAISRQGRRPVYPLITSPLCAGAKPPWAMHLGQESLHLVAFVCSPYILICPFPSPISCVKYSKNN